MALPAVSLALGCRGDAAALGELLASDGRCGSWGRAMIERVDPSSMPAADRRYERWQAANARADQRRLVGERVALGVIAAAISVGAIVLLLM